MIFGFTGSSGKFAKVREIVIGERREGGGGVEGRLVEREKGLDPRERWEIIGALQGP
jgi:hypothetical protein